MTDAIRLPDLIPAYAAYQRVNSQEAAYTLHQLMERLRTEFRYFTFPDDAVWVRNFSGADLPGSRFRPYADGLVEYFKARMGAGDVVKEVSAGAPVSAPLGASAEGPVTVPAGMVYFSRERFCELVGGASAELLALCEFLSDGADKNSATASEEGGFRGKELASIQNLTRALLEIIIELDRAHRGVSRRSDPSAILRAASRLDLSDPPSRWQAALTDLAAAVEVEDFRGNRRTLAKYVGR